MYSLSTLMMKLSFSDNIQHLYGKCIQRVKFLRELVSVRLDQNILTLFDV